jgi:multidrug efflux system outer membrane protein
MPPPRLFPAGIFFLALVLAGCKVGPDYQRPEPLGTNALPPAFSAAVEGTNTPVWKPAAPAAHRLRGSWWQVFGDEELNRLEDLSGVHNQAIEAAVARLEEARASVKVARADLLPQVELDPSYTRQRTSFNAPENGVPAGVSPTFHTFTGLLQAGWEADVWGRVRRQVESARAQLAAGSDDLQAVKLVVQAELAVDYFALRAIESETDVVERSIDTYRRSLELTVNRRRGGVVTDLDVSQAQTQLRTAEAALPELRLQRVRLLHAIAALCGQPATGFALKTQRGLAAQGAGATTGAETPTVPLTVPSELLERRPDIAAAERRMAGANAQVGVAKGAFYPHLRLNGLAGFQSVSASTWFEWPSGFWSVGPEVQLPLFTGGRNRAQLALSRASYKEAVAAYRQTVLTAFQEVEDQIAAQDLLEAQLRADTAAMASAQQTLEIANNRYKSGLVTYLEVATAQTAALALERTVVQIRGDRLVAVVGLIKALGGGWE